MRAVGSASTLAINSATEELEDDTISGLISLLRSAFQPSDFDKVQQILMTREEKMKRCLREMAREIEDWKNEYNLMERKRGELALAKLEIEDDLTKCKRVCNELREQVTRLNEDQRVYCDREKRANHRYDKLLEDFKRVESDKAEVILQLKAKSTDLECVKAAKRRAEGEIEAWRKKFGELELRVSLLEGDIAKLTSEDPLVQKNLSNKLGALDEDPRAKPPVSHEIVGDKETSDSQPQHKKDAITGCLSVVACPQVKDSASNCDEKVHALALLNGSNIFLGAGPHSTGGDCDTGGSSKLDSEAIIQIIDSEDEMPSSSKRKWTSCASTRKSEKEDYNGMPKAKRASCSTVVDVIDGSDRDDSSSSSEDETFNDSYIDHMLVKLQEKVDDRR